MDDDPAAVSALRDTLASYDVIIDAAADAPSACALLDQHAFCGMVLDVVLTSGSGFDVLHHIHGRHMDIPTVVVTAKFPLYVRDMLSHEQVRMVFPKPVEPRVLAAIVLGFCGMAS